jgi:hypothetical protein
MKGRVGKLNLELLRFHVAEAKQELECLLLEIRRAQGEKLSEEERNSCWDVEFRESRLSASLEHAYHHLNFAWKTGGTSRWPRPIRSSRAMRNSRAISSAIGPGRP